jgi:hypothetical protein
MTNLPDADGSDLAPERYWQEAAMLFQPALIRLLDQIRNQLAESTWKGTFETRELWPMGNPVLAVDADTPEDESPNPPSTNASSAEAPQVLYLLNLTHPGQTAEVRVNIWELCYQICFQDYQPQIGRETIADFQPGEVTTDMGLFDADGEVDWHQLDHKAHQVVAQLLQEINPE